VTDSTAPQHGRVLLVEDDVDVAETLAEMLQVLGYEVRTAVTGAEGFGLVTTFRPNVVLLDLRMPGISGIDALPLFRQHHPSLPVIVVTANIDPEIARLVLERGAVGYLQKPFDVAALEQLITAAMTSGHSG
jgi:CheY-like chemotaxis protein